MAARLATRCSSRTQKGHHQSDRLLDGSERWNGKRRRAVDSKADGQEQEEEDKDITTHRCKRARIEQTIDRQHRAQAYDQKLTPSRSNPPRQCVQIRSSTVTRAAPSHAAQSTTKTTTHSGSQRRSLREAQPGPLASPSASASSPTEGVHHLDHFNRKAAVQAEPVATKSGVKRRRDLDHDHEPVAITKRSRHRPGTSTGSNVVADCKDLVEGWLSDSCEPQPSETDEKQLSAVLANMPRPPRTTLPSPQDTVSFAAGASTTASRRSDRSTASTHDPDYRKSMRHRNIFVEHERPPSEVMRRARAILSRPRTSPEMDDAAILDFRNKSRALQEESEAEIVQQLAPVIIPAMNQFLDRRLARNPDQSWSDSVPIPLDPSVLVTPLPLPKPKPDFPIGYSEAAFTRDQQGTIDLLIDDRHGRSYAIPDHKLRFPFFSSEYKSQAKGGTHYVATNQAAGAGAVAMNGALELARRSFGLEAFDYSEPQFFSLAMDHELARINVHWIKVPTHGEQHSFHTEGCSKHLLDDPTEIQAVHRAIKNILDYCVKERLPLPRQELDVYRQSVLQTRKSATDDFHLN